MLNSMRELIADAGARSTSVRPETARSPGGPIGVLDRVYANTFVDVDEIHAIGFDYDHTLVVYKKELNRCAPPPPAPPSARRHASRSNSRLLPRQPDLLTRTQSAALEPRLPS